MTIRAITAVLVAVSFVSGLNAQSSGKSFRRCDGRIFKEERPETVRDVRIFWQDFQDALRQNDKQHLAAMANYPLSVSFRGRKLKIHSEKDLAAQYAEVFPSSLRAMLLRQSIDCVGRVGWRGFTVAEGQIWFDQYPDGKFRFLAVNAVVYAGD